MGSRNLASTLLGLRKAKAGIVLIVQHSYWLTLFYNGFQFALVFYPCAGDKATLLGDLVLRSGSH